MGEKIFGAANPAAAIFQEIHHLQIRHRIDPKNPDGLGVENPLAGPDASFYLVEQFSEHFDCLLLIGTKMDSQHFGNEHLKRRDRTRIGRENKIPKLSQSPADLIRFSYSGRKFPLVQL